MKKSNSDDRSPAWILFAFGWFLSGAWAWLLSLPERIANRKKTSPNHQS